MVKIYFRGQIPLHHFCSVGYSLSIGKGEAIETTLAALQVVPEPFRSFANTLVDICAYAGQSHNTIFQLL